MSAGAAGLLSLPSGEGLAGCGPQGPLASCCKPLCSQHTGVPVTVGAHPCAWLCACLCAHPRARPCDCPCARPYARSQGLPTARLPASEALPVFLHSPGWWSHLLAGVSPAHILPHPSTPPASIRRLPLSDLGGSGPPRCPPLQWGPVGPGPRGRHHSAPERHPGLVSLLHQRSPNVRDLGCGLDKGVSRGASALGPRHQELIGRATAAPVTPLAYTSGCWGLLGLHLHQSHFPISFC